MVNLVQTWAMHDYDKAAHPGARRINRDEAKALNEKGFGIFHTVQSFDSAGRNTEQLVGINAWAVDIDDGTKEQQMKKIRQGLKPTMIVETKRGYQVYWACADQDLETAKRFWKAIVEHRLIPYYSADKRAKDFARLMRVPGFYHLKDPQEPFLIREVSFEPIMYSSHDMLEAFADLETPKEYKREVKALVQGNIEGKDFWDRLFNCNQEELLTRLSGHDAVMGEVFSFKNASKGKKNIFVNGKSTSTFIGAEGRIGSLDGGGPTVYQWLRYYKHEPKFCVDVIKSIAPELGGE